MPANLHEKELDTEFTELCDIALNECRDTLNQIDEHEVIDMINMILSSDCIYFIGAGRVGLSLKAMSIRFCHLGLKAYFVGQIGEPPMSKNSLLVVASGSGESIVPVSIGQKAKMLGGKVIYIGSNKNSILSEISDLMVQFSTNTKLNFQSENSSHQLLTSRFEQSLLIFGDVVSKMLSLRLDCNNESMWKSHANLE